MYRFCRDHMDHMRQQLAIFKNRKKTDLYQSTDFYHDSYDSSSVDELLNILRTQKAIVTNK